MFTVLVIPSMAFFRQGDRLLCLKPAVPFLLLSDSLLSSALAVTCWPGLLPW